MRYTKLQQYVNLGYNIICYADNDALDINKDSFNGVPVTKPTSIKCDDVSYLKRVVIKDKKSPVCQCVFEVIEVGQFHAQVNKCIKCGYIK